MASFQNLVQVRSGWKKRLIISKILKKNNGAPNHGICNDYIWWFFIFSLCLFSPNETVKTFPRIHGEKTLVERDRGGGQKHCCIVYTNILLFLKCVLRFWKTTTTHKQTHKHTEWHCHFLSCSSQQKNLISLLIREW